MLDYVSEIQKLKKEKNAVILAHYYVEGEVQQIADYVGDSYYLAKIASEVLEDVIIFCGVSFMGESAKILNPEKKVFLPDLSADCPMAHMADIEKIKKLREEYEDLAVVCYINSTALLKMYSDVCVTSSNAIKILKALPNKNIFFIPDENLARFCAKQLPEKNFIFNDGYCHVHADMTASDLKKAKENHPNALVLAHPECKTEILELADYIGSTSGIIDYSVESSCEQFIVATEVGVLYEMKQKNPNKEFIPLSDYQICPNMKKINLEKILDTLENGVGEVFVDDEVSEKAISSLNKMLELAK